MFGPDYGPDQFAAWLGSEFAFSDDSPTTDWVKPVIDDWEAFLPLRLDPDGKLVAGHPRVLAEARGARRGTVPRRGGRPAQQHGRVPRPARFAAPLHGLLRPAARNRRGHAAGPEALRARLRGAVRGRRHGRRPGQLRLGAVLERRQVRHDPVRLPRPAESRAVEEVRDPRAAGGGGVPRPLRLPPRRPLVPPAPRRHPRHRRHRRDPVGAGRGPAADARVDGRAEALPGGRARVFSSTTSPRSTP